MFNIGKARAEIEERNRVGAEAQLPLLSVPQELRKLYELQRQTGFEEFFRTSSLRQRIEQKVLNRMRRLRGERSAPRIGYRVRHRRKGKNQLLVPTSVVQQVRPLSRADGDCLDVLSRPL
jgi:hypothetical protein